MHMYLFSIILYKLTNVLPTRRAKAIKNVKLWKRHSPRDLQGRVQQLTGRIGRTIGTA